MNTQWSIESFFQLLQRNDEPAILLDDSPAITYHQLLSSIDTNVRLLQPSGPSGQSCIVTIDVSLSWRFIPLMLAAFKLRWTVIPIDSVHDKTLAHKMNAEFPHALHLDESNVDDTGLIKLSHPPTLIPNIDPQLAHVALMVQTSGTSGHPKLVMLTYENLASNAADIVEALRLESHERILIQRPLSYSSALTGELLAGLAAGSAIYIKPAAYSPLLTLSLIQKHAITTIGSSPTLLTLLAPHTSKYDMSSLQRIILSGERLTETQLATILTAYPNNVSLWNAYGMTETAPRISCLQIDSDKHKAACVGPPLRHVNVAIVNSNGGPVPEGSSGFLIVSGPNVMRGYYNNPELTQQKIRDGWLFTGDTASIQNGMIIIHGRADHMIIRAGCNIYPEEIESLIAGCPGVYEAYAFGIPHSRRGAEIHVWLTCADGVTTLDIQQYLLNIDANPRLWPDVIHVRDELPKTSTGKRFRATPPI
ncbi:class I adenylate-forming enzyme family protein [Paenibacillus kobensis]|uniref:class I adenylate-forming enzyme family protein n=1 Tax=Paenibacillus kobensis TaxID=59841 RepID=UPI000FD7A005|nr:fatty acid--CoA ligase family protein [Paenibacillus kobensis]